MNRVKQSDAQAAARHDEALAITNISDALEGLKTSDAADIHVRCLAGDSAMALYAAEIPAGGSVRPHYHEHGAEIYYILHGAGRMRIGKIIQGRLCRLDNRQVRTGDCFSINEGMAHQLINTGAEPMRALFCCPSNHLDSDRFFTDTMEDCNETL